MPVHQDGSCNGLQHYAALGRDLTGGYAVNLCPSDKPQVSGRPGIVYVLVSAVLGLATRCRWGRYRCATGLSFVFHAVIAITPRHIAFNAMTETTPPPLQDVYTGVCALVRKRVEADAAAGVPEASSLLRVTTGESGWRCHSSVGKGFAVAVLLPAGPLMHAPQTAHAARP